MRGGFVFILVILIFQSTTAFSQKVLKVQGNKVVIGTRGLDISEGDILTISSDGFEAGKIKILKVGSKTAIGKITEGSALKGDSIQGAKSFSGSSRGSAKKGKKSSKSSAGGAIGVHLGFSYSMLSNITSQHGDYTLSGQSGFLLMADYRTGKDTFIFGIRSTSGDAEFTSKQTGLIITGAEVTSTNLFARMANPINRNFYFTYGGQFSMVSIEDSMQISSATGTHTLDLKGLGAIGGAGYDLNFGAFVIKAEALAELNYYFMNSSKVPGDAGAFDTGAFMIYGLHFNLSLGYRF